MREGAESGIRSPSVKRASRVGTATRRLIQGLQTEWSELGRLGRVALIGVVASVGLAVGLGFLIPSLVRGHIIDARAGILSEVSTGLVDRGLVPNGPTNYDDLRPLDEAVRSQLLGGETVRVKVWSPDGTITYSDLPELIGESFTLEGHALDAFAGEVSVAMPDLADPENVTERGLGNLIEFYIPVRNSSGEVFGVFEVYQEADSLNLSLNRIRRNVWISIGIGLGLLGLFMGSLTLANANELNRRRRQAENLLDASLQVREEERERIVGALHNDIGQPLYRVTCGIENCRAILGPKSLAEEELTRLKSLVGDIDRTLRNELRELHHTPLESLQLPLAVHQLVETTEQETNLEIDFSVEMDGKLDSAARVGLIRAVEEALMNVRKHAQAERVVVRVESSDGQVLAHVEDDGSGSRYVEGLGLATSRRRLEAIGGGLAVTSRPGGGTVLKAWVPVALDGDQP